MGISGFCLDPFWDSSISWNNTWPQLTDCFQASFLLPLPCFYLWLFLPFHLYFLYRRLPKKRKASIVFFILKLVCCSVMLAASIAGIIQDLRHYQDALPASLIFVSTIKISSYILVIFTIILERKKSTFHSAGLLMFFCLMLLTHIVPFYSKIILQHYLVHPGSFAVFYIEYGAVLLAAILHSFNNSISDQETTTPEERASIFSWLTLWWTTGLVISGYKKPLTEEKINPLGKSEQASTIVPGFLEHLSKQTKHLNKQKSLSSSKTSQPKAKYTKYADGDTNKHQPLIKNGEPGNPSKDNLENGIHHGEDFAVEFKDYSEVNPHKGLGILLWKVILFTFRKQLIKCCLMHLLVQACTLTGPLIIKLLIEFMSSKDEPDWHGYLYAAILFICSALGHMLFEFYFFQTNKFGMRVKTALFSSIYRKCLCLSSEAKQQCSSGEVIHLLSKDCDAIGTLTDEGFALIECPLELIVGIIMVWQMVGVAMFAGMAVMGVFFIIKALTARKHAQYDQELKECADQRMKIASQVFSGIKVLKLYAWEEAFKNRICAIRKKELAAIFKYDLFRFFITFAWTGAVFWMIFFTFLTHIFVDENHHLTASTVFVTMAYFTYIRRASNCLASVTDFIISGINSAQRVAKFLMLKEIEESLPSTEETLSENTVLSIYNGSFAWAASSQPVLKNVSVEIPKGSLVAVVGMVGSGKSSLLSAILGEMVALNGSVHKKGTVAYVPQEAWIQNDSVKNNILFGSDFKLEKYDEVVKACALTPDLSILPSGDQTEIGEKGINLSGGQKQRISMARAVYQDSDVYLLDDPLSAVDTHVGQHIFKHIIGRQGLLKEKTRILVTHGIHWLPEVDRILVITNGNMTEQGSLEELMRHNGPFAHFLSQYLSNQQQGKGDAGSVRATHDDGGDQSDIYTKTSLEKELESETTRKAIFERLLSIESQKSEAFEMGDIKVKGSTQNLHHKEEVLDAKLSKQLSIQDGEKDDEDESRGLIEEEEIAKGRVEWSVYTTFVKSVGYVSMATLASLYLGFYCFDVTAGFWLTFWVDSPILNNMTVSADSPLREQENMYYLGIYSLWGVLGTLMIIIFSNLKAWRHKSSSRIIHEKLITSVLASPIQFFDTTPIGRLLSRFSKDISVVDCTLLLWMEIWTHSVFAILSAIVAIIINIPAFLAVAIPVVVLFYIIEKFYLPTSCQLRRLERKWLAPIFSHASESFAGTSVIRALKEEARFIRTAEEKIDFCQKIKFASYACERWLSIRMGVFSDLLILFTGLLAVTYRSELSPGLTGLSLSLVLTITNEMALQVRMASFMEMDIVSVERILQYSDLPSEAARHLPCPGFSKNWPTTGNITFSNLCVRYRSGLDLVLKNVTFDICDGEKIGVVGRTGAGKSSLMLSLFRLIEPSQGKILIDGLDISKLGLYDLRQKLTILPQDPVLFSGSLRSNFDPFEQFTDEDIWRTVDHCHLKSFVDTLPEGLSFPVGEGGDNLSIGQRQLVCLGRALLRKTKILVLDEATAAVDVETDDLIQKTIRTEFKSCTVLTIAHRLNTIMDYDRILVLDQGQVVEFNSPSVLLEDNNSMFHKMVADSQVMHSSSCGS